MKNGICHFITFYSPRGGVGRTNCAYNVGALFSQSGRKVLLADLDLDHPGLTRFLATEGEKEIDRGWVDIFNDMIDLTMEHFEKQSNLFLDKRSSFKKSLEKASSEDWAKVKNNLFRQFFPDLREKEESGIKETGNASDIVEGADLYRKKIWGVRDVVLPKDINTGVNKDIIFIPAGAGDDETYREALELFHDNQGIFLHPKFQEVISEVIREGLKQLGCQYVLFDSRSGLTDVSLFSCISIPDWLVVFSGMNQQHLHALGGFFEFIHDGVVAQGKMISVVGPLVEGEKQIQERKFQEIGEIFEEEFGGFGVRVDFLSLHFHPSLLFDENLIVNEERGSALSSDYRNLHSTIRSICKDDVEEWTRRFNISLNRADFPGIREALISRRGLDILADTRAGESVFRGLVGQANGYLFRLPASDLKGAEGLLEDIRRFSPNSVQCAWIFARCLQAQGRHDAADGHWKHAISLAEKFEDDGVVRCIEVERAVSQDRWGLGVMPGSASGFERADLEKARSIQFGNSDAWGMALTNHSFAEIEVDNNNYDEARRLLEEALKIHRQQQDNFKSATALHSLGLIYRTVGSYKQSIDNLKGAIEIKSKDDLKDHHGISILQHSYAELHRLLGNEEICRENCDKAIKTAEDLGQERGVGVCYFTLSELYRGQGKVEKSRKYTIMENDVFDVHGSEKEKIISRTFLEASECLCDNNKSMEEFKKFRKKVDLLPFYWRRRVDVLLSEVLLFRGEFAEAEGVAAKVAEEAREDGFEGVAADAHAIQAIASHAQSKAFQASAEEAREFYRKEGVDTPLARRINDILSG